MQEGESKPAQFGSEPWRQKPPSGLERLRNAMPAMPAVPSAPQWSQVTSVGVCSPASAASDVQTFGEEEDGKGPEKAHEHKPAFGEAAAEKTGKAAVFIPPVETPSKFAAASEAAKNVIALVDTTPDGKRGRRRGAAARVADPDASTLADTAEHNDTQEDSSWRRGCTPAMPAMPSMPTREGLAGKLACSASRKEEDGSTTESSPPMLQRFACTGTRKDADPAAASDGTTEQSAAAPTSYVDRLKAAASCGAAGSADNSQDAQEGNDTAPIGAFGRVRAAVSCGAPSVAGSEENKSIATRMRDTVSCSASRTSATTAAGAAAEARAAEHTVSSAEGVADEQGVGARTAEDEARGKSLLARLKEAGTCSPVTQVRVQAAMSQLPQTPSMPQVPSQLSCAAARPRTDASDHEDVSAQTTPSMLGRVKAAASCGYLPVVPRSADHQLKPVESAGGGGVLGRYV